MRPIDADRLLQELAKLKKTGGIFAKAEYSAKDVENLIRKAPVLRIRPNVRTGLWVPSAYQDGTDTKYLECTNCGEIIAAADLNFYNFCPNCGADMRPHVRTAAPQKKPESDT